MNNVIVNILFIIPITIGLCFYRHTCLERKASGLDSYCLQYSYFIANMGVILSSMNNRFGPNIKTPDTRYTYDSEGNIKEEFKKVDGHVSFDRHSRPRVIISGIGLITILITTNIPTVIYLLIYGISREKMRAKLEMQKMAIQDLN